MVLDLERREPTLELLARWVESVEEDRVDLKGGVVGEALIGSLFRVLFRGPFRGFLRGLRLLIGRLWCRTKPKRTLQLD